MDERKQRDFNAGLSDEVDAFLRGEPTRRDFIKQFGQMAGMLAISAGRCRCSCQDALAQAAVDLADASTPLGKAQAAAMKASTEGPSDGSAYRAVQAAKKFKGVTLNVTYEAGLQALDPRNFSGPVWEQLTGTKTNVVELSHPDQYSKPIAEHIANSGAYDILDIEPAWTPSLADGGVIQPLDDYIARYMNRADLEDYHPLYKALPTYKNKIWGFFDDGDMFALYYRKDIFEDPKMKEAYQRKFSKPLVVPTTWEDYAQVAQFITDQMAPNVYGAAHFRKAGAPGNQYDFLQQYRANGGVLFDDNMKAQLNSPAGMKTFQNMLSANKASITGNNELDAVSRVGGVAAGEGGNDLFVAADGTHERQLFAERQGDQLRPAIRRGRQGRLCTGPGQSGARHRLQQGARRRQRECGGRLSLHAMGDIASRVAGPLHASLLAARSLSPVALQIAALSVALADGEGVPGELVQLGEQGPARHDHARLAGLRTEHRQDVHLRLGRHGPEGGAADRRRRVERDDGETGRSIAEGVLCGVQEAARLLRRPYGRDDGHGREDRLRTGAGRDAAIARAYTATVRLPPRAYFAGS